MFASYKPRLMIAPVNQAVRERNKHVARVPAKLFKIGEVMEHSGFSRQMLHNYTVLGLISAAKRTPSGHRLYDEAVFGVLERIKELKKDHTLEEIRRTLGEERSGKGATPRPK